MLTNQKDIASDIGSTRNPYDYNGQVIETPQDIDVTAGLKKKYYIESYGCQMNFSDSEIVASILNEVAYESTNDYLKADLILINTCSIR